MRLTVTGEVVEWRGPAPHHFVRTGPSEVLSDAPSYGWGCVPVTGRLGSTTFTTSLIPRDEGWMVPLKAAVRRIEQVDLGDVVTIELDVPDPR